MSAATARDHAVTVTRATWETHPTERGAEYRGVPGTWHDVRKVKGVPSGLVALVCCPTCREVFAISSRVHSVRDDGVIQGTVTCTRGTCAFRAVLTLEGWNVKKPLYAVAIERWDGKEWIGEMHHTYADSAEEAKAQCAHLGGVYRIGAAALAIGFLRDGN